MELTFLGFDKKLILGQPLKYQTNLVLMLSGVFGMNEGVVEIHKDKAVDEVSEDVIN